MGAMAGAVMARWLRITLVTLLLLAVTYLIVGFMPKMYESAADILVESRQSPYTRAANDTTDNSSVADDTAISSQIQLIRSRTTLLQVIESENLRDVPELNGSESVSPLALVFGLFGGAGSSADSQVSDEVVLGNVAERLQVERERNSRIISVIFRSTDPDLAARVANAIARAHVARRSELSLQDTAEATKWLEREISELRDRVAEAEARVAEYRVENDLLGSDGETSLVDQQLSDISAQITAAQERRNSASSRANLIRGLLDAGQPIDGVPDVRESVVVQQLSEEKARLQAEKAQKLATLLPNHPDIAALTAQINEIEQQIAEEGRQVADALQAEAQIEADLITSLRNDLQSAKSEASTATKDQVTLNALEREASAHRSLLETYLLRYRDAASRTNPNSALPDVRVVSVAAAAINPASPNTKLILAAVFIVAIMVQLGQILFAELLSGRALVTVPSRWHEPEAADDHHSDTMPEAPMAPIDAPVPSEKWADVVADAEAAEPGMEPPYDEPATDEESELEPAATPTPAPAATTPQHLPITDYGNISHFAADIAQRGSALVLVSAVGDWRAVRPSNEALVADLVARGRSVAEIDAGSHAPTDEYGLSDLCAGEAGFGDIVYRGQRSDLALVPWGRYGDADFGTRQVGTLVEALADIFEIVVIDTGAAGSASALTAFAVPQATVLLLAAPGTDARQIEAAYEELRALGLGEVEIASAGADLQVA